MQAVYAWYTSGYTPSETYDHNLRDFAQEIQDNERQKGEEGDYRLLTALYYDTIERKDDFDQHIQSKAGSYYVSNFSQGKVRGKLL